MSKLDRVIEDSAEEQLATELAELRREFDDFKTTVMVDITKIYKGAYGSNSNGEWWILPGGLLICTATVSVPGSSSPYTWTYPRAFSAVPYTVQANVATHLARWAAVSSGITSSEGYIRVWTPANELDGQTRSVRTLAIGPA